MPILLDSNLLTLLVAHRTDAAIITRHKRLRSFTPADGRTLAALLGKERLLITPGIVSEASNLLRQTGPPDRGALMAGLADVVRTRDVEVCDPHALFANSPTFRVVGATDAALLYAAEVRAARVVSCDAVLVRLAFDRRLAATNFNHLRIENER